MPYTKTSWADRNVEYPQRYDMTTNADGTVTLTPHPGTVTDTGTPLSATNMNHLETQYDQALADSIGTDYIQSTAPADTTAGKQWFNPSNDVLYVADGSRWVPIPPVHVLQEVSTFTESGISLANNGTRADSGSLQLGPGVAPFPTMNSTGAQTSTQGLRFVPSTSISSLAGSISDQTSGITRVRILQGTTTVATQTISGNTFSFSGLSLSSGTTYRLLFDNSGSSYTSAWYGGASGFPFTCSDFSVTAGEDENGNTSTTVWYVVNSLYNAGVTSGDCVVSWNSLPTDLKGWDLATFARTLAGETVTIDVEDGSGTVLFSDIGQNFNISTIASTTNPQFHVYLSRASTSNNPTCDYLARRFLR